MSPAPNLADGDSPQPPSGERLLKPRKPTAESRSSAVACARSPQHRPSASRLSQFFRRADAILAPPPRPASTSFGALFSGAVFTGEQRSGQSSYYVKVHLHTVDMPRALITGYLHIHGLTDQYPELVTFFEGEVVDFKSVTWVTRRWEASAEVDRKHWRKFDAFHAFEAAFNTSAAAPITGVDWSAGGEFVFMRWKEHFLVPDHTVQSISGASFAGFYYICYCRSRAEITGFYYHSNSEWYQYLQLRHAPTPSQAELGVFEFR